MERVFTPAEAAAVSEVGVKAVHNAIDKRIVEGRSSDASRATTRRALTGADLLRLKLWYGVGSALAADRRKKLFDAILAQPDAATVKADAFLIVDVAEARRQLEARLHRLDEAEANIHCDKAIMAGEPVFKGTRVPVRTVAAMLAEGASTAEIAEGYPSLTPSMIALAEIWSAAHPVRGRPRTLAQTGFAAKSTRRARLRRSDARPPDPSADPSA